MISLARAHHPTRPSPEVTGHHAGAGGGLHERREVRQQVLLGDFGGKRLAGVLAETGHPEDRAVHAWVGSAKLAESNMSFWFG